MALFSLERERERRGKLIPVYRERDWPIRARENRVALTPLELKELPSLICPCSLRKEESPSRIQREESGSSSKRREWLYPLNKEEHSSPSIQEIRE